ncbi:hypothetical protein ACFZA2_02015 [Microbacterium sp. NPDC007973]|uniref:hypothetical protein n=1 Tax=Microbacterium sp. NPDC007973 TaxID=3364182 RepID=UPI0036E0D3FA
MSATIAEALRDAQHALDNWTDAGCKVALRELVSALTAPPAEDVREAVAKAVCAADEPTLDYERKWPSETDEIFRDEAWRYYLGIADRLIASGIPAAAALAAACEVRPRGTVTDAEEIPDTFPAALGELVVDSEGDGINHVRHITLRDVLGQHILSDVAAEAWALTRQARP